MQVEHGNTDFKKEVRNLWILEAATDKRSVKIGIPRSMIKLLENTREGVFLVKLHAIAIKFY